MQAGSGTKNPPWARSNVNTNMTGMNPSLMDPNSMMSQQGMMPFQQTQAVFNAGMMQTQGGMGMPLAGQMQMNQMAQGQMYPGNVVAYPTPRAMNPGMYQNSQSNQASSTSEQRVFTGTVTKTHNDFGFVDHDVFYQTSVCTKGIIPKVNDRVLVEASYNPNMPFKWNATRVQVLPKSGPNPKQNAPKSNSYNAVPPPSKTNKPLPPRRDDRGGRDSLRRDMRDNIREDRKRSRSRTRSRSRDRRDSRNRRDSPLRKRQAMHQPSPAKYVVRVPRMPLDIHKMDVPALSQRYTNLYIPSDFFTAQVKWGETFPPQMPFSINNPCSYHIMSKDAENPNPNDSVLEPPDSDYRFSAKVMLISMPTLESLYQKCGLTKPDDKDKRSSSKSPLHPTRLIKFLVGQRGKGGENFAIGGPWSPSLDGENPDSDPSVLVRTAIRTCKALTGIDLSACTQWYRMVEFYYWREGSGGKSRLESVVLFLPDVWSAQASRVEWATIQDHYRAASEQALKRLEEPPPPPTQPPQPAPQQERDASADKSQIESQDANDSTITIDETDDEVAKLEPTHYSKLDLKTIKVEQLRQELRARKVNAKGVRSTLVSRLSKLLKSEEENENQKAEDVMEVDDEVGEEDKQSDKEDEAKADEKHAEDDKKETSDKDKKETTDRDKRETADKDKKDTTDKDKKDETEKKEEKKEKTEKEIEEEKRKKEKERQAIKTRYELPSEPHIIVHPNSAAKGGKFTAHVATLSLLLDYRITDNKEHSFELFVFAELFNEMLMRDFGFYIYKTLYTLPEKAEEVKEVKDKDKEKEKEKSAEKSKEGEKKDDKKAEADKAEKKDDKDKKEEKDKDGEKKKDDKDKEKDSKEKDKRDDRRDDRRESRRRRDSHSDDSRSGSPRRRSRGVELPPDPYLLLSLVYFDTGRGGAVNRKDLQNLFMSLGLQLSRSQIKSILEKVCIRDSFSYKSLMQAIKDLAMGATESMQDLPLDSSTALPVTEVPPQIAELEATIAAGNRELLPVFNRPERQHVSGETQDVSDTGLVLYKNRLIDVGALVAAEARGSTQRAKLEEALLSTRAALQAARQTAASTLQAERGAQTQLSDVSSNLQAARARIQALTASSKIFHSALKSIQAKVEAVVNIKYEDDDVVEVVANGPMKTEKDPKKEKSELVKTEVKGEVTSESKQPKEDKEQKAKEEDIVATENMDLDDKE